MTKESNFFKDYEYQHHLDRVGEAGFSRINLITVPDTRQSFGGPHQLYLLVSEITDPPFCNQSPCGHTSFLSPMGIFGKYESVCEQNCKVGD